jgi:hypothetical protein
MDASQWGAACQKVDAAIVSHKATVKSSCCIPAAGTVLAMLGIVLVSWAAFPKSDPGTGEHVGECAALCAKWGEKSTWGKTCSVQEIPQWTEESCSRVGNGRKECSGGYELRKLYCFPTEMKLSKCGGTLNDTPIASAAVVTCQSGCCYYNDASNEASIPEIVLNLTFPALIIALVVGAMRLRNRSQVAMDHALGELNQTVFGPAGFRATFWAGAKHNPAAVFLQDLTGGQGGIQMQPMGAMPATQVQSVQQGGVMPQAGVVMAAPVQAPPVLMSVTVPDGMQAGQMLMIMTPAGMQMQVQIPAGVSPGQAFQVQAPAVAPVQDISVVRATRVV